MIPVIDNCTLFYLFKNKYIIKFIIYFIIYPLTYDKYLNFNR